MRRSSTMISAAYSSALTAYGASAEWASRPRTRPRIDSLPLWPVTTCMPVGSPTMHIPGATPQSCMSRIMRPTPMQPTSSSYDNARWIGAFSGLASMAGTAASTMPTNDFMSAEPRPRSRSSRSTPAQGSTLQDWPSTGTTSVCPDSTMPGRRGSPIVANRFAFALSSSCVSRHAMPCASRYSRTQSISARFDRRLVVSKPIRRRMSSRLCGASALPSLLPLGGMDMFGEAARCSRMPVMLRVLENARKRGDIGRCAAARCARGGYQSSSEACRTGANERRCAAHGPCKSSAARCSGVP
jgi:hypothetical protein